MSNPHVQYYISSGAKNAMRTLRRFTSSDTYYNDEYICNLARDYDVALEKAKGIVGKNPISADMFELNGWGEKTLPRWETDAVNAIKMGKMPFGKHAGKDLAEIAKDKGYVKFWVEQNAGNMASTMLIQSFTDIANENGYFDEWEKEAEEAEKKELERQVNSKHFGEIGERIEFDVKCLMVLSFEGHFGLSYFNICETRTGESVIYKGSNCWTKDHCYKVRATIKEHEVYKGVRQTVISRPAILEKYGSVHTNEDT